MTAGTEKPGSGAPGKAIWLQGLACGAAVALATPCTVLAGLLLAPGLGVLLLERETGRPTARATLLCGAAMAIGPVASLWRIDAGVGGALTLAADVGVLGGCWAAQGAGWLVAQLAPVLIRLALEAHATTNVLRLKLERARYEAEWGIPQR